MLDVFRQEIETGNQDAAARSWDGTGGAGKADRCQGIHLRFGACRTCSDKAGRENEIRDAQTRFHLHSGVSESPPGSRDVTISVAEAERISCTHDGSA